MSYTIGIDVGGTFTDIVVTGADGRVVTAKSATTPRDQSDGVLAGIALAAEKLGLTATALLGDTGRIVHGTTVATNALLERKGARVGMLTTEGHRDVIEMREGLKPERYNLRMAAPEPLVARRLRLGVAERMSADGTVARELDRASLDAAIDALAAAEVQAVAICFLHSWRNPAHERAAAEAVRARLPAAYVTLSSDVLCEIKEFERFTTTVVNAAVGPVITAYLGRLQTRLREAGYASTLFVILSHGGVASVEEASRLAAGTALSGPAGGVAAAVALARAGVARDLITFDMGGTSTDIALVRDGQATLASGRAVGDARIALPGLDIVTLGAGGGSIARPDRSGLLQVGPQSAGADPGPACYGQGGNAATVTDANLALGYLDPALFLGGRRRLDAAAATRVIAALAEQLGIEPAAAAAGVHRLVNSRMADGVRIATVRRGVDPRRHTLLAFGGAAGLHVSAVAAELGIAQVVVPLQASVPVRLGDAEYRSAGGDDAQPGPDRGAGRGRAARRLRRDGTGRPPAPRLVRRGGERRPLGGYALRRAGVRNRRAARYDALAGGHPGPGYRGGVPPRACGALHLFPARPGCGAGQCPGLGHRPAGAAGGGACGPGRIRPDRSQDLAARASGRLDGCAGP